MTHQEFDKRLDEMLETLASGWRGWTHDQLDGTSFIKDELDGIEKTKSDAKQAIRELFIEDRRLAQRVLLNAIIDMLTNPPAEIGAAEDIHFHPWQIEKMLTGLEEHFDELDDDIERLRTTITGKED